MSVHSLLPLLHLTSPSLPIGAFAYSQGLEAAVEKGWVTDEASLIEWLSPLMSSGLANLDLPILLRAMAAWKQQDLHQVHHWQEVLLANRETFELEQEELQLGKTLKRLLQGLGFEFEQSTSHIQWTYVVLFAKAMQYHSVEPSDACRGFLWSWLENQITVACKTIPLGQSAAQQVLVALMPTIEHATEHAKQVEDKNLGLTLPNFAMASAWHETQYSRLFRS